MKTNILSNNSSVPECTIKFNNSPSNTHISQILAGFKMLDNDRIIKIKNAEPCSTFRSSGNYEHNSIIEVKFNDGKLVAYDMADGYQSIHRPSVLNSQLERLDAYFKRSYSPKMFSDIKNFSIIKPLGLNYYCTCKNNPYDAFYSDGISLSEAKRFAHYISGKKVKTFDYSLFESNSVEYDEYNLLFLTRIWDYSSISEQGMLKTYPYFTSEEAKLEAEKWRSSLHDATVNRINYIRKLKEHFGNRIVAGVSDDDYSRKTCKDLIIDPSVSERFNYINMIKKNYICLTSEGLHKSIGWKFAEYVAAGKAIVSEPLYYEVPYGFAEGKNYLLYSDIESCIKSCETLLNDVQLVHEMEKTNKEYYEKHIRPDMLVLDSLKNIF